MPTPKKAAPRPKDLWKPSEVFGHPVACITTEAVRDRKRKWCPFQGVRCNKSSLKDPIGICSYNSDKHSITPVCPHRFLQNRDIFRHVSERAFPNGSGILKACSEISAYAIPSDPLPSSGPIPTKRKKLCRFDYVLGLVSVNAQCSEYCIIETQSVYISGKSIRVALRQYLKDGDFPPNSARHIDWPSSAKKRMLPQLRQKVALTRHLNVKLFVVIENEFFKQLGLHKKPGDEVDFTFVVYGFEMGQSHYTPGRPRFVDVSLAEVEEAVNGGNSMDADKWGIDLNRRLNSPRMSETGSRTEIGPYPFPS